MKMPSYQYRKSHCEDKTIFRPSYLHSGISYIGKMPSLYRIRALSIIAIWVPADVPADSNACWRNNDYKIVHISRMVSLAMYHVVFVFVDQTTWCTIFKDISWCIHIFWESWLRSKSTSIQSAFVLYVFLLLVCVCFVCVCVCLVCVWVQIHFITILRNSITRLGTRIQR